MCTKSIHYKVICLFFLAIAPLSAEYNPPTGSENFHRYISPSILAGGVVATSQERPQAQIINPAVSGRAQIPAYGLSYVTLFDTRGEDGWGGHVIQAGGSHPTKAGVFGWGAGLFGSRMRSFDIGTVAHGHLSFAKAMKEDLLVGIGIGGGIGSKSNFDWALYGDLGVLGFMKPERFPETTWGVAVKNLGKMFDTGEQETAFPSPFTPLVSFGVTLVDTDILDLDVDGTLSFPFVQNVRASLGMEMSLFETIGLQVSTTADLREMVNPEYKLASLLPEFGLSARFAVESTREPIDTEVRAAGGNIAEGVWATGVGLNGIVGEVDNDPPSIALRCRDTEVLSFSGGYRNEATVDVAIEDSRYILGYAFIVEDALGNPVRIVESRVEKPAVSSLGGAIKSLGYIYASVDVPDSITWDGKGDDGEYVNDGMYRMFVTAWDDNGNVSESKKCLIEVDSTAPTASVPQLDELERVFSPNNDGNKDRLRIEQTGSEEILWVGTILRGDNVVKTYTWENGRPESFSWDGVTDGGTIAGDGVYRYELTATDEAGNGTRKAVDEIVLDSQITPISLAVERSHFSPNGDARFDTISIYAKVPITSGIREWTISIYNSSGEGIRRYAGKSEVPEITVFDGLNDNGAVIPEGEYTAEIEITYVNGNNPKSASPKFTMDITPPEANVTSEFSVFSPDGDGNKDTITFFQETSVEQEWTGEIYTQGGLAIKQYSWFERADSTVSWDGHGLGGLIAPNGTYSYRLFSEDKAGNRGSSRELYFDLNTEAANIYLSRQYEAISPNSDGIQDAQRFVPQVSSDEGIASFTLSVLDDRGEAVRTFSGRNRLDEYYIWDGLRDDGGRVSDGEYYAKIELLYENGNTPSAATRPFEVDTVFPTINSTPNTYLFSPNGDGNKDTVTFRNTSSQEDLWEARIVDRGGKVVRRVFWKGRVSSYVWDGTDDVGNQVSDGEYYFEIFTTDSAGNYSIAKTSVVTMDTRQTPVFVSTSVKRFSPNGDGKLEDITFTALVTEVYGVTSWELSVMKTNGSVVKTFEGSRIPEKIVWNGTGESGDIDDGEYRAKFKVAYDMGNISESQSTPFYIDTEKPEIELQYSPAPFSPDGDRKDDLLVFDVEIRDMSAIEKWSLTIIDPRGELFKQYQGTGMPPGKIYWNGTSTGGELVMSAQDYPFEFYAEDVVGNSAAVVKAIPVDILVRKDNGALKIEIANFYFEPNSPDLTVSNERANAKNQWILNRIAEFCRKQSGYYISVKAHAVSIYWNDPERSKAEEQNQLKPLTEARAKTIGDALAELGIDKERISTEGMGGAEPIVPHGDLENRWKNKRIEFILYN